MGLTVSLKSQRNSALWNLKPCPSFAPFLTLPKNSSDATIQNYRTRNAKTSKRVNDNGVVLAGIKDIAAMKINAVIGRGTKKDFIDLFFLLRRFTLQEMLDMYIQKYPEGSLFIAMKSLSYFEDAESDPMPVMLSPADWNTVKAKIRKAIAKL